MCLDNFKINKKELFGDQDSITLYKVVELNLNHNSIIKNKKAKYKAPYRGNTYKLNRVNISDRKGRYVSPSEHLYREINKGIHVCLSFCRADIIKSWGRNRVILKCLCLKEDYVAHNHEDAVFTKIKLLSKEAND